MGGGVGFNQDTLYTCIFGEFYATLTQPRVIRKEETSTEKMPVEYDLSVGHFLN